MTTYKLICIGGTGQMVLHYYLQLYLLGLVDQAFEAVLIDTDAVNASIRSVQEFLTELQYGADVNVGADGPIAEIKTPSISAPNNDKVIKALTGREEHEIQEHPVRAFFNEETLTQTVHQGLFARPALSSVMSHNLFANNSLDPKKESTVVFVGSVIGGTSGGLLAPIVYSVHSRQIENAIEQVKMRAVLFGRYFVPNDGIISDATKRFSSNEVLVLKSVQEALNELHSYFVVGGTESVDVGRDPNLEKNAIELSWPGEREPFWRGIQAAEYLLKETARPAATGFADREVPDFVHPIAMAEAEKTRRLRLSFVDQLIGKEVVLRLAKDPWCRAIWGNKLTSLLSKFWTIAIDAEGGKPVNNFPQRVQDALETLWRGKNQRLGLRSLFPTTEFQPVSPGSYAKVEWPLVDESKRLQSLFGDAESVAKRAAATIMFAGLRKGK